MRAWAFLMCFGAFGMSVARAAPASDFEVFNYDLRGDGNVEMPGRLYVPPNLAPGETRPLVLFLHGSSEQGTNNTAQVNRNIDGLYEQAKADGFFLYAPQTNAGWIANPLDTVMSMVAKATQDFAVDTDHLYVTGISMGGGGTKLAITRFRDNFAAAVPVSGVNQSGVRPADLVGKPIWLYHGAFDNRVYSQDSDSFVNAIRAADGKSPMTFPTRHPADNDIPFGSGAPYYPYTYNGSSSNAQFYDENNLRYSLFTVGGHTYTRWNQYYREPWLYEWMYDKTNAQPRPQQGQSVGFDLGVVSLSGADSQGRTWNASVSGEERTLAPVIPFGQFGDTGRRSGVSLTVTDAFADVADRGRTGGPFDHAITRDTWTVTADDPGTILIDGLTPGESYRVEIFASDTDSDGGRGRLTRYTIGDEFRDLELYDNVDRFAIFADVVADEFGRFELVVAVAPGSGARFGGIGTLQVTAVPEPGAIVGVGAIVSLCVLRRR